MAEQTGRSLRLTPEQLANANTALSKFGSKRDLAADLSMSPTTVTNFFAGRPVQRREFHAICKKLKLDWQPESLQQPATKPADIDELVREARDRLRPLIEARCGTMRVLDMTQPIGLGEIYTHVNILEKISGRRGIDLITQMQAASPEEFERFSLGGVAEERIPGLEAVEKHHKLMILGKPGAGKTTFLKHLAIQCTGGRFQADRIPIFITLKDFAETEGTPDLLTFLQSLLKMPLTSTQQILDQGRALILLDGLDEVRETDAARILRQIRQFSERYASNAFVITCRIAAREYTFEQFTEVEVADFDDDQIADVSRKWFHCKQDTVKAERFLQQLEDNPPIKELATSPLLLTLLCLVFEDSGDFPANRAELYQNGIDVLLKKWDSKRNIDRAQFYKKLSLKRKEDLLSQIAYQTFEAGNYFFKQKEVERQIREFIENLPGASSDEETLNLDSEAVLKSIEAQHGLFVERARGIYSFSHLTFHEYFAAREIKEKSHFTTLAKHFTDRHWREVILLTVGMLPNADACLQRMKQAVDEVLAGDTKLQLFLTWVDEKARSVNALYKPAAVRAFYFTFAIDFAYVLPLALALPLALIIDQILAYDYEHDINYKLYIHPALNHTLSIDDALSHILAQVLALYDIDLFLSCAIDLDIDRALDYAIGQVDGSDPELKLKLENLSAQLPNPQDDRKLKEQWWQENKVSWAKQLRALLIENRKIGHDWQFSDEQKKKLQQYYDANTLLVACLKSDCYVSPPVREEIEATLLLPIRAIKQASANAETEK